MRRLAFIAALAVSAAPAAVRAEPLDLDLSRLGPPDSSVWTAVLSASGLTTAYDTNVLATQSRQRFAVLSTQMALAMTSALLQPASTTGYSGFQVGLESAMANVESSPIGAAPPGFTAAAWPTQSGTQPSQIFLPSVHVQKALPFSLEFGGRLMWLNASDYYAAQGEAKWAVCEGFRYIPDIAFRAAYTRMLGVNNWDLSATDLDVLVSVRFAIRGVMALTPYVAARLTYVNSSTERMDFAPNRSGGVAVTPTDRVSTEDAFPGFSPTLYRTTFGLRYSIWALTAALEATYFSGSFGSSSVYQGATVPSSFSGAASVGASW